MFAPVKEKFFFIVRQRGGFVEGGGDKEHQKAKGPPLRKVLYICQKSSSMPGPSRRMIQWGGHSRR